MNSQFVICKDEENKVVSKDFHGFTSVVKYYQRANFETKGKTSNPYFQIVLRDVKVIDKLPEFKSDDFEFFFSLIQPTESGYSFITEEGLILPNNDIIIFKNIESAYKESVIYLICRVVRIERDTKKDTYTRYSYGYGVCPLTTESALRLSIFPAEKEKSLWDSIADSIYRQQPQHTFSFQISLTARRTFISFADLMNITKGKLKDAIIATPLVYQHSPDERRDFYYLSIGLQQTEAKAVFVSCRDSLCSELKGFLSLGGVSRSEVPMLLGEPIPTKELKMGELIKITLTESMEPDQVHFFLTTRKPFSKQIKGFTFVTLGSPSGVVKKKDSYRLQLYKYPSKNSDNFHYLDMEKLSEFHEQFININFIPSSNIHTSNVSVVELLRTKIVNKSDEDVCTRLNVLSEDRQFFTAKIFDAILFNLDSFNSGKVFDALIKYSGMILFSDDFKQSETILETYFEKEFNYQSIYNNLLDRVSATKVNNLKMFKGLPLLSKIICKSFSLKLNSTNFSNQQLLRDKFKDKAITSLSNGLLKPINENESIAIFAEKIFVQSVLPFSEFLDPEEFVDLFKKLPEGNSKSRILLDLAKQIKLTEKLAEIIVPLFLDGFIASGQLEFWPLVGTCTDYFSMQCAPLIRDQSNIIKIIKSFELLLHTYKSAFVKQELNIKFKTDESDSDESQENEKMLFGSSFFTTIMCLIKNKAIGFAWGNLEDVKTIKIVCSIFKIITSFLKTHFFPTNWLLPSLDIVRTVYSFIIEIAASGLNRIRYQINEKYREKLFSPMLESLFSLVLYYTKKETMQELAKQYNALCIMEYFIDIPHAVLPTLKTLWGNISNKGVFAAPLAEYCLKWFTILDATNSQEVFAEIVYYYYGILKEVFREKRSLKLLESYSITGMNAVGASRKIKPELMNLFFQRKIIPLAMEEGIPGFEIEVKQLADKLNSALNVMFNYMSLPDSTEFKEERLYEGAKMMKHFKTIDKDSSLQYLYNIFNEYNESNTSNNLEKGLIFVEHANDLSWINKPIEVKLTLTKPIPFIKSTSTSSTLKENLLRNAIQLFIQDSYYYQSEKIAEILLSRFTKETENGKARKIITDMISCLENFNKCTSRTTFSYFYVKFIGSGFPVSLRDAMFIYKMPYGTPADSLKTSFSKMFQRASPQIALSNEEKIKVPNAIILFQVYPKVQVFPSDMPWNFRIQKQNMDINIFESRPRTEGQLIYEFKTRDKFPYILTRSEVIESTTIGKATPGIIFASTLLDKVDHLCIQCEKGRILERANEIKPLCDETSKLLQNPVSFDQEEYEHEHIYASIDSAVSISSIPHFKTIFEQMNEISKKMREQICTKVSQTENKEPDNLNLFDNVSQKRPIVKSTKVNESESFLQSFINNCSRAKHHFQFPESTSTDLISFERDTTQSFSDNSKKNSTTLLTDNDWSWRFVSAQEQIPLPSDTLSYKDTMLGKQQTDSHVVATETSVCCVTEQEFFDFASDSLFEFSVNNRSSITNESEEHKRFKHRSSIKLEKASSKAKRKSRVQSFENESSPNLACQELSPKTSKTASQPQLRKPSALSQPPSITVTAQPPSPLQANQGTQATPSHLIPPSTVPKSSHSSTTTSGLQTPPLVQTGEYTLSEQNLYKQNSAKTKSEKHHHHTKEEKKKNIEKEVNSATKDQVTNTKEKHAHKSKMKDLDPVLDQTTTTHNTNKDVDNDSTGEKHMHKNKDKDRESEKGKEKHRHRRSTKDEPKEKKERHKSKPEDGKRSKSHHHSHASLSDLSNVTSLDDSAVEKISPLSTESPESHLSSPLHTSQSSHPTDRKGSPLILQKQRPQSMIIPRNPNGLPLPPIRPPPVSKSTLTPPLPPPQEQLHNTKLPTLAPPRHNSACVNISPKPKLPPPAIPNKTSEEKIDLNATLNELDDLLKNF